MPAKTFQERSKNHRRYWFGQGKSSSVNILSLFSIIVLSIFFSTHLIAQWSATLTVQPYPSSYINDWQNNPAIASLTISYTGTSGANYFLRFIASTREQGEIARGESSPRFITSGPAIETLNNTSIINWQNVSYPAHLRETITRTGRLPEGRYTGCAQVIDATTGSVLTESCAEFTIVYPNPPALVYPGNGDSIEPVGVVFQWTPVTSPPGYTVTYTLRLCEVLPGQPASRALELNTPVVLREGITSTVLTYPPEEPQLERGKTYVWQVRALDQYGSPAATNDGKSEIWSFSVRVGEGAPARGPGGFPQASLWLVTGAARLINLDRLSITETSSTYTLDGSCDLEILASIYKTKPVTLHSLTVQKSNLDNPVFTGGSVTGSLSPDDVPDSVSGRYITFTELRFEPATGLQLYGNIELPGTGGRYPLGGGIRLTAAGLSGSADISGAPLFTIGSTALQLRINQLSIRFSEPRITLSGQLSAFDGALTCDLTNLTLSADSVSGIVSCTPNTDVPFGPAGTLLQFHVNSIDGRIATSLSTGSSIYDLSLSGNLSFAHSELGSCDASVVARFSSDGGFQVIEFTPSCASALSEHDLGWLRLSFNTLRLDSLVYHAGSGWSFGLRVNLQASFPDLPDLDLPALENVGITVSGISIPALNFTSASLPSLNFGGFGIKPLSVRLPAFTYRWSDWSSRNTDAWAFDISFKLTFPNLSAGSAACLIDPDVTVEHASFAGGNFSATIPVKLFSPPGCALPLGDGVTLNISELSGTFSARSTGSGLDVTPNITVRGKLTLPSYFGCTPSQQLDLGTTALTISGNGLISGTISGLVPPCPLNLGIFSVTISDASLAFSIIDGAQSIILNGRGTISLPAPGGGTISASGTIAVDLLRGRMISGSFEITEPFVWNIPTEGPVLSFRISHALFDTSGLEIDGRNQLLLPGGATIGCTFDHLLVNPMTLSIIRGRVLFDLPFAFKVGISDGSLSWAVVQKNEPLPETTGIILNLPDTLSIDSSGLQAHGNAFIHLKYDGRNLDSLLGRFSHDFGFAFSPFGVSAGQVEFFYESQRVAVINRSGFFPDPMFFGRALLPAKLGLPDTTIAYLKLKEGETLLINAEVEADGDIHISTYPSQPVALVFPILKFDLPTAPQLNVNFDLTIDPMGFSVKGGSFSASIPAEQLTNFDLTRIGIPLQIESLDYHKIAELYAFTLSGKLKFFDHEVGSDRVSLTFTPDARITGDISLSVSDSLPIVSGSNRLLLRIGNVSGSFDAALAASSFNFTLNVSAGLIFRLSETSTHRIDADLRITQTGIELTRVSTDSAQTSFTLPLGPVSINVSHLTIPSLSYSKTTGWDFDLSMDLALSFPGLGGVTLPAFSGTHLRPSGFTIPEVSIPDMHVSPFTFFGASLKPLAFRMSALTFNWFTWDGTTLGDWGFSFDFELNLPELPSTFPEGLRNPRLTVLNAGYRNGRITGRIEARPIDPPLTIALADSFGLNVHRLAGALRDTLGSQQIEVTFQASLTPPPFMRCSATDTIGLLNTELTLSTDGRIRGRIAPIVPPCPIILGPIRINITTSELRFDFAGSEQLAKLALQGNVRLPSPTPGDTISAAGYLVLDLVHARIDSGEINITQPFVFSIPTSEPVLRFQINSATLNRDGLRINGSSQLLLTEGTPIGVTFNNVLITLPDFNVGSGSIDFSAPFAFRVGLGEGGHLTWGAVAADAAVGISDGFVMNLPASIGITADGFRASGRASAAIRLHDSTYAGISANFSPSFLLQFTPFKVAHGRVDFFLGETNVAYMDSTGFWPGDFFGILPIPARLPLPNERIAYVQLKDARGNLLIHSEMTGGNLRLYTRTGEGVQLVVPALAYGTTDTPRVSIGFDVTVNPRTFDFVSGSIDVQPPSGTDTLFSLVSRGIPLVINRLKYANIGASYGLTASASLALPQAIGQGSVRLDSLTISEHGISGSISVGNYSTTHRDGITPVRSFRIADVMTFTVDGVQASLSESSVQINFSGDFIADVFADNSSQTKPIHYSASLGTDSVRFSVDLSHLTDARLPLYVATFEPVRVDGAPPINVSIRGSNFTVTINGILRIPSLNPDFAITVRNFQFGTGGVTIPDVSITTPSDMLSFTLFGAQFALIDTTIGGTHYPAIDFNLDGRVLHLITSGRITFLEHTARFYGLNIGTNGSVSVARADLIDRPIELVENVLSIDTLRIVSNKLQVNGGVVLPEPFDTIGRQGFSFAINSNGSIEGGARIQLVNETPGLGSGDRTEFNLWIATFDLTYLGVNLNFSNLRSSSIQMVADVYWQNDVNKRVQIGSKSGSNVSSPGLEITFAGDVNWGSVTLPSSFDFDFEALRCTLNNISLAPSGSFELRFSGSLRINLSAVSGGLDFRDFRIARDGFHWGTVSGGNMSIIDVVTIEVSNIGYSSTPTTITVRQGNVGNESTRPDTSTEMIRVDSYFRFGASISIAGVGGGGIDEFLTYRQGGATQLIIRNAHLDVESILEFGIDLKYFQSGSDFSLLAGGSGTLLHAYGVTVVGKVAKISGTTSFGVFVAASVQIPIGPGILITQLGGGFFYNPTSEDLNLVKARCNLGEVTDSVNAEPGRFAVLLYGGVSVITNSIAEGRVLLTFTDNYFGLDAAVELLSMGDNFSGRMHLQVGLRKAYAEGNIRLNVNMASVVTGNAHLEFYVYGSDAWGIMGGINVEIVRFLHASADLFVGPPGFMVDCKIEGGFDIWIISVDVGFEGLVWYKVGVSWGAYMKIWIEAEVLWGVASAKGWMEAALVYKSGFILYGLAGLRISVLFVSWEGSVWAKWDNGSVDAGFGRDSEMDKLIDEARSMGEEMEEAKEQALDAMEHASRWAPIDVSLSEEDLARMYQNLRRMDPTSLSIVSAICAWFETRHAPVADDGTRTVAAIDIWAARGAPDSVYVRNARREIDRIHNQIESKRPGVEALLNEIQAQIAALPPATQFTLGGNPAATSNFGTMPITTTSTDSAGNEIKQVTSQPTFSVDDARNNQNQSSLSSAEEEFQRIEQQIVERIQLLENTRTSVKNAIVKPGGGGIKDLAEDYVTAQMKVEKFYAEQNDYLRGTRDWAHDRLIGWDSIPYKVWLLAKRDIHERNDEWDSMLQVAEGRIAILQTIFHGVPEAYSNWEAEKTDRWPNPGSARRGVTSEDAFDFEGLKNAYLQTGMDLWYNIARAGLRSTQAGADSLILVLGTNFDRHRATFITAHQALTSAVDALWDGHVNISEQLYDLYDRYIYWKFGGNPPMAPQPGVVQPVGTGLPLMPAPGGGAYYGVWRPHGDRTYFEKRDDLLRELAVPQITSLNVTTSVEGRHSRIAFSWHATHPRRIEEYAYSIGSGVGLGVQVSGFQLAGLATAMSGYDIPRTGSPSTEVHRFTMTLRARGGAGYTLRRMVNYETHFAPTIGPGGTSQSSWTSTMTADNTPPMLPTVNFPDYGIEYSTVGTVARVPVAAYSPTTSEIHASWHSYDNQSDIMEYEYSVGTSRTDTSIIGRTSAGGMSERTIRGLNLQTGRSHPYYVNVRAKNGAGLWSNVGSSVPLYIDTTAPSFQPPTRFGLPGVLPGRGKAAGAPQVTIRQLPPRPEDMPPANSMTRPCCSQISGTRTGVTVSTTGRDWGGNLGGLTGGGLISTPIPGAAGAIIAAMAPPRVEVEFPRAYDDISPIEDYYYYVSHDGNVDWSPDTWRRVENRTARGSNFAFEIVGLPLPYYGDSAVIAIRAKNLAGLISEPIVSDWFKPVDMTPPQQPEFCVTFGEHFLSELRITISSPARDFESGIKGYQFGVGTAPGLFDVRPLPPLSDNPALDFTGDDIRAGRTLTLSGLRLRLGYDHYVTIRAINGVNLYSATTSGPVNLTVSQPSTPVASPRYEPPLGGRPGTLILSMRNVGDLYTRIQRTEVAIGTRPGATDVISWQAIAAGETGNFTRSLNINLTVGRTYYLSVRSVNTAGRMSNVFQTSFVP